jgi:RNA-directed DNA polymerase
MDTTMLRRWLTAGYLEQGRLFPTERGTGQGGPLSPVLANCTLDGLERLLAQHWPTKWPNSPQVHFARFADDFVITGRGRSLLETEVKPLVEAFLQERGLTLSPEKTVVTHISDGVDFLGQHLRKYHGALRVTPSAKNTKAFLDKVRTTIAKSKQASAGDLIERLNPIIRGWALFHRHVSSSRTRARVDHAIFQALWAWARRRHPKKGAGWVRKHYFHTVGNRHWVFSGTVPSEDGTPVTARLYAATSCRFQRHTKVKAAANPYDPVWRAYFAQRRARRTPTKPVTDCPPAQEPNAPLRSPQTAPLLEKGGVRRA